MPKVVLTPNLAKYLDLAEFEAEGSTVGECLSAIFRDRPGLRGYLLEDQGNLRKHVVVFIDGETIRDRAKLTDPVGPSSEIYVLQALSGGR